MEVFKNNVKAGTATVTIKGTGIYSGTVSKNFEIKKLYIRCMDIRLLSMEILI